MAKLPAIPAKNAGKHWKNGEKRWETILAFCRSFAGDWCQNGVIVFVGDGFRVCRRCFERVGCRDWCRLFWKIIILLPGNFK